MCSFCAFMQPRTMAELDETKSAFVPPIWRSHKFTSTICTGRPKNSCSTEIIGKNVLSGEFNSTTRFVTIFFQGVTPSDELKKFIFIENFYQRRIFKKKKFFFKFVQDSKSGIPSIGRVPLGIKLMKLIKKTVNK